MLLCKFKLTINPNFVCLYSVSTYDPPPKKINQLINCIPFNVYGQGLSQEVKNCRCCKTKEIRVYMYINFTWKLLKQIWWNKMEKWKKCYGVSNSKGVAISMCRI